MMNFLSFKAMVVSRRTQEDMICSNLLWLVHKTCSLISFFNRKLNAETFQDDGVSWFKGVDCPPFPFAAVNFYQDLFGVNHHVLLYGWACSIVGCFPSPVGSFRAWR